MNERSITFGHSAPAKPPPLTLYIHLPWCGRKCPYCDFNSHQAPARIPEKEYIDALFSDLEKAMPAVWGRALSAVFIGGGTPSLFSAAAIDRLLAHIRALFNLSPLVEITLEANPDSSDMEKFSEFKQAGVNRLSLGVQSFNDRCLKNIGRLHDGGAAHRAAVAAVETFNNVNIDLMHALPEQGIDDAAADVEAAIAYRPAHLSLYQLTLEAGTVFFRSPPPALPDDELTADMTDCVNQRATAAGYEQYEISAYARGDQRCRHNLNYWQFGDYLGIGAGSHSKITAADGKIERLQRVKHWRQYMQAAADDSVRQRQTLSAQDTVFEFMLNALRLTEGFSMDLLTQRVGGGTPMMWRMLALAEERGLIKRAPDFIRPSEKGRRYLNDLTLLFLSDNTDKPVEKKVEWEHAG